MKNHVKHRWRYAVMVRDSGELYAENDWSNYSNDLWIQWSKLFNGERNDLGTLIFLEYIEYEDGTLEIR